MSEPSSKWRVSASVGRTLHGDLSDRARHDGLSLSQYVLKLLSQASVQQPTEQGGSQDLDEAVATTLLQGLVNDTVLSELGSRLVDRPVLARTLSALTIAASSADRPAPRESRQIGRLAMEARKEGRRPLSQALFRLSLRLDPGNTRSRSNLGQYLYHAGAFEDASEQLQDVVRADPADNHALLHLGLSSLAIAAQASADSLGEDYDHDEIERARRDLDKAMRRWAAGITRANEWGRWKDVLARSIERHASIPQIAALVHELKRLPPGSADE